MDVSNYKASITDPNVPDETILKLMKEELADRYDKHGVIIPPSEEEIKSIEEISELLWQTRPAMMKKYSRKWAQEHSKTCPFRSIKMRTFTRKHLIKAYEYIEKEREEEYQQALRAAEWLQEKCNGIHITVSVAMPPPYVEQYRNDIPYLPIYTLAIAYQDFSSFSTWLTEQLKNPELPGISIHEKGFWLQLGSKEKFPRNTRYYCYTEYIDVGAF
ncbi:MAG: hypothetical protein HYT37_03325 [Candidatus Sungbacteria bacterium]|nr:hypothetical protein [Candidatus Sungbacteria bacterium]